MRKFAILSILVLTVGVLATAATEAAAQWPYPMATVNILHHWQGGQPCSEIPVGGDETVTLTDARYPQCKFKARMVTSCWPDPEFQPIDVCVCVVTMEGMTGGCGGVVDEDTFWSGFE